MHGSSRKRSGSRVLVFCRQHPDKMLDISTPYTCQETTVNFYFGQEKTAKVNDSSGSPCVRRFELPTFWSVAKRSIQLS